MGKEKRAFENTIPLRMIVERTFPKNVTLEFHLDPGTPALRGDAAHLQAALLNLAVNARDAMEHGGSLRIACSRHVPDEGGEWARIEIEDSGPGIPTELREVIFQPFFLAAARHFP